MSEKTVELTETNFETTALRKDGKPVLIDYWATWCAPCRMMEPVLEALADELDGTAVIGKVNADEEPALAQAARVQAVPTLLVLKDGEVVDILMGVQSKNALKSKLEALAA